MTIQNVYIGGWFQRTTLHLSEIHEFLELGRSPLSLDAKKLRSLRDALHVRDLAFHSADLDYCTFTGPNAIHTRIYEDGLIMLSRKSRAPLKNTIAALSLYYEEKLSKAISYLFSLGAPLPKELANIKTIYPYFIVTKRARPSEIRALLERFKQKKYFEIIRESFEVYRGDTLYIINNRSENSATIERFIGEQIFIREFKAQLHRYLNLHRIIWEKIAAVKERGAIRGSEIPALKEQIEGYGKTITLIETRIKQMASYIKTREAIFKEDAARAKLVDVLQFKYETLRNSHAYIQELWVMTTKYVESATKLFDGIQAKSTEASVKNLAIITSVGVGATLIGLFTQKRPEFTSFGFIYFMVLVIVGYTADRTLKWFYKRRMYKIREAKAAKNIQ